MNERLNLELENSLFNQHLATIGRVLGEHGVEYSLVGGLALNAILGKPVSARRPNGSRVDFDAVAIGPDIFTIKEALKELESHKKEPMFPSVGIEPIHFGDGRIPYNPLTVLSTMRKDSQGGFSLVFRDLEVKVPPETMKLQRVLVNGVPFSCFPTKTIFWRYGDRTGSIKPKDVNKLTEFSQYITGNNSQEPGDELYGAYFIFAEQIKQRYPAAKVATESFWKFDRFLNGRISGASGIVYGVIGCFHS